jgi:stage II sporulation protein M
VKQRIGQVVQRHLEIHSSLYLFSVVLFFMGVVFGALTVQSLGYTQQNDLFYYFERFVHQLNQEHFVDPAYAFYQNFIHSLRYVGFIWLLGLSIIGLPVILIMLFMKGVFLGFTVGFLVHQMGWNGFLFAFVSIMPQNVVIVPLILLMSVLSISFSFKLIAHLFGSRRWQPKKLSLSRYIGSMAGAAGVLLFVSFIQTYISPLLIRLVS